jgi:DNA-binding transcriptional regulator YdaS (Cro superfamily)
MVLFISILSNLLHIHSCLAICEQFAMASQLAVTLPLHLGQLAVGVVAGMMMTAAAKAFA